MKVIVIVLILFAAMPLFAQPQITIDNRTDAQIDTARLERLAYQAVLHSITTTPRIVLHLWSKKDIRIKAGRKLDAFFAGPNEIYLSNMDYLSFVQGLLLATFPEDNVYELEAKSRRIFLAEQAVVDLRRISSQGK